MRKHVVFFLGVISVLCLSTTIQSCSKDQGISNCLPKSLKSTGRYTEIEVSVVRNSSGQIVERTSVKRNRTTGELTSTSREVITYTPSQVEAVMTISYPNTTDTRVQTYTGKLDGNGNVTRLVTTNTTSTITYSSTENYTYDSNGYLHTRSSDGTPYVDSFYYANGNRTGSSLGGNGVYTYDLSQPNRFPVDEMEYLKKGKLNRNMLVSIRNNSSSYQSAYVLSVLSSNAVGFPTRLRLIEERTFAPSPTSIDTSYTEVMYDCQ